MLPRFVPILALFAMAFLMPAVHGAQDPACYTSPPREETAPIAPDMYLYVGQAKEKVGFWQEKNQRVGLQTDDCLSTSGEVVILAKDKYLGLAPVGLPGLP